MILLIQHQFSVGEVIRRLARLCEVRDIEGMVDRAEFLNDWGPEPLS